jgi:hypothetical protein
VPIAEEAGNDLPAGLSCSDVVTNEFIDPSIGLPPAPTVVPVELAAVCPSTMVIQTDWFPEVDHGWSYQMIGPDGDIDAVNGSYSGEIGNTGVRLDVRAGGPYIDFSSPASQIYTDRDIFGGYADTSDVIRNSGVQPLISVFASYEVGPQILMWDPEVYPGVNSIEDIRDANAPVLYFQGAAYMDYLLHNGLLNPDQIDASYDGSPNRFVAEGNLVQQGFATQEIYKYENDIDGWKKPLKTLLIHDTGHAVYQSALSVRPDTVAEYGDCLAAVVPMFQQAQVDYMANPGPVNAAIEAYVTAMDTFWTLSAELNADGVERMLDMGLVSNGNNSTIGDFDCARVDELIAALVPIAEEAGNDLPAGLSCSDVVTNEFIDPSIGLG